MYLIDIIKLLSFYILIINVQSYAFTDVKVKLYKTKENKASIMHIWNHPRTLINSSYLEFQTVACIFSHIV